MKIVKAWDNRREEFYFQIVTEIKNSFDQDEPIVVFETSSEKDCLNYFLNVSGMAQDSF